MELLKSIGLFIYGTIKRFYWVIPAITFLFIHFTNILKTYFKVDYMLPVWTLWIFLVVSLFIAMTLTYHELRMQQITYEKVIKTYKETIKNEKEIYKRDKIKSWREYIDKNFDWDTFRDTSTFSDMKPFLSEKMIKTLDPYSFDKTNTPTIHLRSSIGRDDLKMRLLDEITKIEKEWKLI